MRISPAVSPVFTVKLIRERARHGQWNTMTSQSRLRVASWVILAAGLIGAAAVYIFAPDAAVDPFGDPSKSKMYLHNLEIYGGRANVIQDEFLRWFNSLWHGKELAGTVLFISGFAFLVMRFISSPFRLNTPTTPGRYNSSPAGPASDRPKIPDSSPCRNQETRTDEGKNNRV
jgi:hypothetical protein